ncbi:MAG: UDP-N-acetylglucosamine 2-epimerase (non-hydrolyzing) [Kiritimatiellia bacterium]
MKKKILAVVGTRPNFIKITQFHLAARRYPYIEYRLCHTGQHFDAKMSDIFFQELEIPPPDYHLDVKADSTVTQMARIMQGLESVINDFSPRVVVVPGDVNSTFAAALTAHKMGVKVAHLESGLRSFDRSMPEENNRILTDAISDVYFVTEESGRENLIREGRAPDAIRFVGNTMIDTLIAFQQKIDRAPIRHALALANQPYVLLTMHRPATVDNAKGLRMLNALVREMCQALPVVFPIHPRTMKKINEFGLIGDFKSIERLKMTEPVGYLDFQNLVKNSAAVVTDSGGIQEETTYYRIPCITLRANTERPCTVTLGTNTLLYFDQPDFEGFKKIFASILDGKYKKGAVPPLWDGKATERIMAILHDLV